MGIKGLSTYLTNNCQKYETKVRISRKVVIVDGSNLMFHLYLTSDELLKRSHHIFGGDPTSYAQCVRSYFQKIKCCSILPIVIFDGAYEDMKQGEKMRRFAESLRRNVKESGHPGKTYTPIFLRDVFIAILEEQEILYFQTAYEADDTIAYAAKQLGDCPILSSDSDFFMCVNSIAINLASISFKKFQTQNNKANKVDSAFSVSTHYLAGKTIDMLGYTKKELKLNEARLLPLAAVVIGNDFVSKFVFANFMNKNNQKGMAMGNADRLEFLLKWFARQPSFEIAREKLLDTTKEEHRNYMRELVNKIVENYMGEGGDMDTWNLVKTSSEINKLFTSGILIEKTPLVGLKSAECLVAAIDNLKMDEPELEGSDGNDRKTNASDDLSDSEDWLPDEDFDFGPEPKFEKPLVPEWFLQSLLKCEFPFVVSTILYNRRVYLMPQVEVAQLPSSHAVSVQIIQAIGGLLYGSGEVTLVSRDRFNPAKIQVPTITSFFNQYSLPCILGSEKDIRLTWNSERRLNILLEALSLNYSDKAFVHEWPPYLKIWVAASLYFLRKLKNTEGIHAAVSVIVAIILSCLSNYTFEKKAAGVQAGQVSESQRANTLLQMQNQDDYVKKFFKEFSEIPNIGSKKFCYSYNIEQVSVFSQFQSALYFANALNSLLGEPLRAPKFSQMNCYMVYNICAATLRSHHGVVSNFLNEHLKALSPLCVAMKKLINAAMQNIPLTPKTADHIQSKARKVKIQPVDGAETHNRFLAFAASVDKWDGEDEDENEDVKNNWDDEDKSSWQDVSTDSAKSATKHQTENAAGKKKRTRNESNTSLVSLESLGERTLDISLENIDDDKVKRIEHEFGFSDIDHQHLHIKEDIARIRSKILCNLKKYENHPYVGKLYEQIMHDLCLFVSTRRLNKIKTTVEGVCLEKLAQERKIRKKEAKKQKRLAQQLEKSSMVNEQSQEVDTQVVTEKVQADPGKDLPCSTDFQTEADLTDMRKILVVELKQLDVKPEFEFLLEDVIREICTYLSGQRLKDVKASIETMYLERIKAKKAAASSRSRLPSLTNEFEERVVSPLVLTSKQKHSRLYCDMD